MLMQTHVVSNDSTVLLQEHGDVAEIFGGRYVEIRNFCQELAQIHEVKVSVITGEYGLITSPTEISRYEIITDSPQSYNSLEEKYHYVQQLWQESTAVDFTVIFVPKEMMRLILRHPATAQRVICVTHTCFKEEILQRGWYFLERRGARIGRENRKSILKILKE
ncbi:hypothetical protein [Candidatus Methanomassiliicoccus intestinalis]|uniref:hypothetical protein n=2 Tax=Candidatus Methanomassiliicoccus intestinalis TaxID=1406512 RepID=UPI0037DD84D8